MSRLYRLALVILVGLCCLLLFMLVLASQNSGLFEKYYTILLWTNSLFVLSFLGLVCVLLFRIYKNAQKKKYGTKILSKFALALVVTGVIPGALIFAVSVQFLYKSVDSWFDVKVERALDSGLTLGREVLESFQANLRERAKRVAIEISETPPANWVSVLDSQLEKEKFQEAVLISSSGNVLGVSGSSFNKLVPTVPQNRILQSARTQGYWEQIDDNNQGAMRAQVIMPIPSSENIMNMKFPLESSESETPLESGLVAGAIKNTETIFLQVVDNIPPSLARNAESLMNGYRDYQEMVFARSGLRNIYLLSLTLVLLLAMLGSIAFSIFIANRISYPLMSLMDATRRVGEGHYEKIPEPKTKDEVQELTHSFNTMTTQLSQTRLALEKRGEELSQAKNFLESILARMSSGVIVLNKSLEIILANESASKILGFDVSKVYGDFLEKVLPDFVPDIKEKLENRSADADDFAIQVEYSAPDKSHQRVIIFLRGTKLPLTEEEGFLLVFDDITAMSSAQRIEAWGEVARRLAHEIKNPLTPIQLAAERLEMKLDGKVEGKEHEILVRATHTIVNQVTAMKQMVDDFRLYAKIGTPKYQKLNLSEFIQEVAKLYQAGGVHLELNLDEKVPDILADPNQLRQVLHNLLSNAMEASTSKDELLVKLKVSTEKNIKKTRAARVRLEVSDNGPGFSPQTLEHAFEPYVTTKSQGTGLGLAMIKKIVVEHGAEVYVDNISNEQGQVTGARIIILFSRLA